MNKLKNFRKGFTLVEVLIVAIIIAILAGMSIMSVSNAKKASVEATISSIITDVNKSIQRASLQDEAKSIPNPEIGTGDKAKITTHFKAVVDALALGSGNYEDTEYNYKYKALKNSDIKPLFTGDSANRIINLLNQHWDEYGKSVSGDRAIKYRLNTIQAVDADAGWANIQFYLTQE